MILREYPGLLPGVLLAVVVAMAFGRRVAASLGTSRGVAWLLIVGFGVTLAATLTPGYEAVRYGFQGSGVCDLSRFSPASIKDILRFQDAGSNVVLFLPLGIAIGLLPRSRTRLAILVAAIALPFVIETIQLVVTPLGRACQSADAVDNLTGLAIGIVVGAAAGAFAARRDREPNEPG